MKKIGLVLTVVIFMLVGVTVAYAAENEYQAYAEILAPLGVFVGTDNGFELDRAPTRAEGIVMLIRLLGVEEEALAMSDAVIPFTDVPQWAVGYVAYAYENGLTQGTTATTFSASGAMDARMYCTFLLRSLGYSDAAGDFTYDGAISHCRDIGLIEDSDEYYDLYTEEFLRGNVAKLSYDALQSNCKGTSTTLVRKLEQEGKITAAQANQFVQASVALSAGQQNANLASALTPAEIAKNQAFVVLIEGNNWVASGVVIDDDGTILTTYDVLVNTYIQIRFSDNSLYVGEIYVQDYDLNLGVAMIKIKKKLSDHVTIGDSSQLREGDTVTRIGGWNGRAAYNPVVGGTITNLSDTRITSRTESSFEAGAGLFNNQGELIGLTRTYSDPFKDKRTVGQEGYYENNSAPINLIMQALTETRELPLADYHAGLEKPEAPTNVRVVAEVSDSIFLAWDSVPNADYYHVYFGYTEQERYHYTSNDGSKLKYYDATYDQYGFHAEFNDEEEFTPSKTAYFYITAVKDGLESEESKVLVFTKYSTTSTRNLTVPTNYYQRTPWVPDFGAIYNQTPARTPESTKWYYSCYYEGDFSESDVRSYCTLLEQAGFVKNDKLSSYYADNNSYDLILVYIHPELKKSVELFFGSAITTSNKYLYVYVAL